MGVSGRLRAFCGHDVTNLAKNGLLTVTFDVNTHHHKLAAHKIMAALYCWRVRTPMYNSLDILLLI
jgi:hypothetical protein